MPIVYRSACAQDLERADALVVARINALTERHGFGSIAATHPTNFQAFSLKDDARGLWVAEEAGEILGFAWSWVCGDLWFLAQLFVSPGRQGSGIGAELLKRTLDHARLSGAGSKALITFTFNTVSQGLYLRHGMFPRFPIYMVSAARDGVSGRLRGPQLDYRPLEEAHLPALARIDVEALGVSRQKHHRYLIGDSATRGFALYVANECAGYVYIGEETGHIGPLAVVRPGFLDAAFRTALRLACARGSPQVSAFVPGLAEPALAAAIEHRMRLTFPMVLMSTQAFGNWSQYLPRNPGFM